MFFGLELLIFFVILCGKITNFPRNTKLFAEKFW